MHTSKTLLYYILYEKQLKSLEASQELEVKCYLDACIMKRKMEIIVKSKSLQT